MAEYLLYGDLHLSDRAPSSCTDDYLDDLFDILDHIGGLAAEREAAAVVCAGDYFHVKTPGRTSHRTVQRVIRLLQVYPCPMLIVPGNHDMLCDRLDSIDETQPLGVVLAAGAAQLLHGWHGLLPLYGVPWLQHFTDDSVRGALAAYVGHKPHGAAHTLVVTHAPLYPLGQELPYENYPADRWAAAMDNHGAVYYGHVHEHHGIHHAAGVTFCNPGALSRGSLHEHNLTRQVQVATWDDTTGLFDLVPVPHKSAAEVFRLADAAKVRTAQATFDRFLDGIGEVRIEITSVEAVMAQIRAKQLGDRVEAVILQLLEEVVA